MRLHRSNRYASCRVCMYVMSVRHMTPSPRVQAGERQAVTMCWDFIRAVFLFDVAGVADAVAQRDLVVYKISSKCPCSFTSLHILGNA